MINKRYLLPLVAAICGLFALSSCADYDPLPWTQNDVFITTKIESGVEVYGISFYSRSNKQLASSKAVSESNEEYTMSAFQNSAPYEFWYTTPDDEFETSKPETGTYSFSAYTVAGEEILGEDVLKSNTLEPATIVTCEFDSLNTQLDITWNPVEDSDYGVVFMQDANGTEVYATSTLSASDTAQSISADDNYWLATDIESGIEGSYAPVAGDSYTVQVVLYLEDDSDEDYDYLQARSIATYDIIWEDEIITSATAK